MEKRRRSGATGPTAPARRAAAARPKAEAKAKPQPPARDADPARPAFPARLDPVVVVPVKKLPPGRWLHEFKLDGYRLLARIDRDGVRLVGRNGHDWTGRVPTIAAALETLPPGTWVDGVVTWEDPSAGTANFARLSNGGLRDAANVTYRAFDVPFLAQEDLRLAPLDARKERLRDALATLRGPRVLPVDAIDGDDASLLAQACERGLEGIISKERESAYFGMRAGTWVKQACIGQDSFLLLGIAPEQGEGGGFALHVGHRSIGGLVIYDGLVIGGFDADAIARIEAHVAKHASAKPELFLATGRKVDPKKYARGAWCEPTLVLEVTFVRRVAGLLRQARFKGFREDIEAAELVR